jgi:hypothetical protein
VSSAALELCKPLISLRAVHKRFAPLTSRTGQRAPAGYGRSRLAAPGLRVRVSARIVHQARIDRPVERQGMSHSLLGFRARPHLSSARVCDMKTVRQFCLGGTTIVIGAMFVSAWASHQVYSQNLDCNNGCPTYAEYALAQRLHLSSVQNMQRAEIATWFSHHPQYSSRLKALAAECESSCATCGDWTCP